MTQQESVDVIKKGFVCSYCGKPCDTNNLKLTGLPKVYHLECVMEACKEAREKLHLSRKKI